jgi:hypothetical protein
MCLLNLCLPNRELVQQLIYVLLGVLMWHVLVIHADLSIIEADCRQSPSVRSAIAPPQRKRHSRPVCRTVFVQSNVAGRRETKPTR